MSEINNKNTNNYVEIFLKIAELWSKVTNITFEQNSFTNISQLGASISNSRIKRAIQVDPEGFLPILVLNTEFNKYCRENSFKLYDIVNKKECAEKIENAKEIIKEINSPIVISRLNNEKDRFVNVLEKIKNSMLLNESEENKNESVNIDDETFIELMFEAQLASIDLRVDQFSRGKKSEKPPILSKKIFQSYSVHNFITALATNPDYESIIAMCLIKDTYDPLFSYFVVGIRNGQRVYIVSDKPRQPHPLYKTRTRRPGRHQAERMEKFSFPYYLLDFDVDSRGDLIPNREEKSIVNPEKKAIPLCELQSMEHENLLWFIMLYNHLVNKFFLNDFEKEELSFTGDMINIKDEANELSKALVVQDAGKIMINIPSSKEMSVAVKEKGNFEWEVQNNIQLYEMEKIDIPSNVLVPIEDSLKEIEIKSNGLTATGYTYDKNEFGTEKELTEDIIYIARYNEASLISKKLHDNSDKRKDEILKWYEEKINQNKEIFFKAIAEGKFLAPNEVSVGFFDFEEQEKNLLVFGEKENIGYIRWTDRIIKYDGVATWDCDRYCAYNGSKSYYKAIFQIGTAGAIAKATGVNIEELPEEIRHYKQHGRYSGNSILDKVDPVENITNPYFKINFWVDMYISKSGYKQLIKKYGDGGKQ